MKLRAFYLMIGIGFALVSVGAPASNVWVFCERALGALVLPDPNSYAQDAIRISIQKTWFGSRAVVHGPDFNFEGRRLVSPIRVEDCASPGYRFRSLFSVDTGNGESYMVLSIDLNQRAFSPSKQKSLLGVSSAERRSRIRAGVDHYRGDLWQVALKWPEWVSAFGIRADGDILIIPTPESLNKHLDRLNGGARSVGPRFVEWDVPSEDAVYFPTGSFLSHLTEGRIPIARTGILATQSQVMGRFVGALMIPPSIIGRFMEISRLLQVLREDPVFQFDERLSLGIEDLAGRLQQAWSDATELLTFTLPVPMGYPSLITEYAVTEGPQVRRLLFRLLSGERLSIRDENAFLFRNNQVKFQRLSQYLYALLGLKRNLVRQTKNPEIESHLRQIIESNPIPKIQEEDWWRHLRELNLGLSF